MTYYQNMKIIEWEQLNIIHCPDRKCKGMLLTHPIKSGLKCSDCGKLFIELITYVEVRQL